MPRLDFYVENVSTRVDTDTQTLRTLNTLLAVRQKNYMFARAYKIGVWDGSVRYFSLTTRRFRTGLLPYILARPELAQHLTSIYDQRTGLPTIEDRGLNGIELRDYQQAATVALLDNWLDGPGGLWWPRGIQKLPTGAGKTVCLADMCAKIRNRILVLVHKRELLHQTAQRLGEQLQEEIGLIGDGRYDVGQRITVGTVQSIAPNLDGHEEFLLAQQALLVDECHHLGQAKTFEKVAVACRNAFVRIGYSATPFQNDNQAQRFQLMGHTGTLLTALNPVDMKGHVSDVTVRYVEVNDPKRYRGPDGANYDFWKAPWRGDSWNGVTAKGAYDLGIVENDVRNDLIAQIVARETQPVLIIVNRIEHGKALAQRLNCVFVTGKEDTAFRRACLEALGNGKLKCLVATTIFDEGVDCPALKRVVIAAGGKSEIQLLQRIGRGMRKSGGDNRLIVYDFIDNTNRILAAHSKARVVAARSAGYGVELNQA